MPGSLSVGKPGSGAASQPELALCAIDHPAISQIWLSGREAGVVRDWRAGRLCAGVPRILSAHAILGGKRRRGVCGRHAPHESAEIYVRQSVTTKKWLRHIVAGTARICTNNRKSCADRDLCYSARKRFVRQICAAICPFVVRAHQKPRAKMAAGQNFRANAAQIPRSFQVCQAST